MTTLEDVFIDPAGYAQLEARYRGGRDEPDFHAVALRVEARGAAQRAQRRRSPHRADARRRWPGRRGGRRSRSRRTRGRSSSWWRRCRCIARTWTPSVRRPRGRTARCWSARSPRCASAALADADGAATRSSACCSAHGAMQTPELARARLAFVLRLQQLTGPAAAKGVEDTALYVYAPLASRNEVGGDPGVPVEGAVERLHALLAERAERTPRALNATNTHDTKRSADVRCAARRAERARAVVGAAAADVAPAASRAADARARAARADAHDRPLHLSGAGRDLAGRRGCALRCTRTRWRWPSSASGSPRTSEKAVREAKVSTSWTDPDERVRAGGRGVHRRRCSIQRRRAGICATSRRSSARWGPTGMWNALARLRRAPHGARRAGRVSGRRALVPGARGSGQSSAGGLGRRARSGSTRCGARARRERTESRRATRCAGGATT